jgi:hypothetical protein
VRVLNIWRVFQNLFFHLSFFTFSLGTWLFGILATYHNLLLTTHYSLFI